MSSIDLLIAGAQGGTNVGQSLLEGAHSLGMNAALLDTALATKGPLLLSRLTWHLLDHRPVHLGRFSRLAVRECARVRPRHFLAVGLPLLKGSAVRAIRELGTRTVNYPTDDPWNPAHRSRWSLASLEQFDRIASPRRANLAQLRSLGVPDVRYVPFGYDPRHCFPESPDPSLACDLIFVGGADPDRVRWIRPLVEAGIRVALYGAYWERFAETRPWTRGQAPPDVIRRATATARVTLCLVRRANRDGHVMRSLEAAAIGGCMAVEDTDEHRDIFGAEQDSVVYFNSPADLVSKVRWLLDRPSERERLARSVQQRITHGANTYADRLVAMLRE